MLKSLRDVFFVLVVFWWHACVMSVGVSLPAFHKDTRMHTCVYIYICLCFSLRVCVCVWNDNPVITASVLASQRLTALFYSDLYNQCHISNTTNQTLRVSPVQPFTHMRSRTHFYMHTACPPSCSQLATILCQTDVN